MFEIDRDPPRRVLRLFGAVWLPLFAATVGFLLWRRGAGVMVFGSLWGVGAVSLLTAVFAPRALRLVYLVLMIAAFPIGWVVSHVLLSVIYFGVVTPGGLLLRVFGRRPLRMRGDASQATYWTAHRPPRSVERYFRQY